jgi:lipoprotein-anchoring transpeptidase ErfK/SrfK
MRSTARLSGAAAGDERRRPTDGSARWPTRGSRRWFSLVAAVALLATACGGEEPPVEDQAPPPEPAIEAADLDGEPEVEEPAEPEEPEPEPAPERTLVATSVVDEVQAFASPDDDAEVIHTLDHPTERGVPRVFLVEERRDDWLQVLLPVRPNGSTGWIREADVELASNPYRIHVDLSDFRLTIHREGDLVVDTVIGYGDEDTPTPGGRYYITELLRPPNPDGPYGPYAFGLSGFSDVHLSFAGGEGVIGIHGTNEPDSIGSTVSAGCIRVDNDVISEMATFLPLGTPVTIG